MLPAVMMYREAVWPTTEFKLVEERFKPKCTDVKRTINKGERTRYLLVCAKHRAGRVVQREVSEFSVSISCDCLHTAASERYAS